MNFRKGINLYWSNALVLCILLVGFKVKGLQSDYTYDLPGNLTSVIGTNASAPSITAPPQSALFFSNNPVSLSVSASGVGISYQWLSNGVPILGATNDTLLLPHLTGTNGNFSVILTNVFGSVTSTPTPIWLDSRGVGMPDWWQLKYFGNLAQSPYGDYDGDGVDNRDEYLEGTNPTNAASFNPRLYIQSPSNGRVVAAPEQPYYTMGQVITLTAIPDTGQDFLGWGGAAAGAKTSIALVMSTNQTVSASFGIPLPVALDNPNLVWTTGGSAAWYGQTAVSEDGTNAAQTGLISNSQQTWLQGVVSNLPQSCLLSFWWNVSSQSPDNLAFALDGTQLYSIVGEAVGWQHVIVNLTATTHALLWTYTKGSGDNATGIPFTDSGWVDEVQIGTPPAITNEPTSQIIAQGATTTLNLAATGTAPINFQWFLNGTSLGIQSSGNLTLNNIQPASAGTYFAIVSNSFGMVTSSVAVVVVNSSSCSPPPSGLLSWWPGGGNALDIIGGNNGTLLGGATYTNDLLGQGFAFGGTNPSFSLPNNFFPFPVSGTTNQPFTFDVWFQTSSGGVIFGQQNGPAYGSVSSYVPGLYVGTDGKLRAEMFWSGSGSPMTSTATVTNGMFHNAAVSYNGTSSILYLDGVGVATSTQNQVAYASAYYYQFGTGYTPNWPAGNGGWYPFSGVIDAPTLFNRALLPQEVATIFDGGSGGMCEPTPYFSLSANSTKWVTNGFRLQLGGLTGQGNVIIYSSTNLVSWNPIFTNPPAIGLLQFVDTNATRFPKLFYRVLQQ